MTSLLQPLIAPEDPGWKRPSPIRSGEYGQIWYHMLPTPVVFLTVLLVISLRAASLLCKNQLQSETRQPPVKPPHKKPSNSVSETE